MTLPWHKLAFLYLLLALVSATHAAVPQVVKSENDDRSYRYLELPNQMRVLLVSDPAADKAATSLDVKVGSADDPADRPGLAHFLEHMLFLGTRKYPKAGEYQQFIDSHGGSHNAYTSLEHTNYFFDIDPAFLEPALDRFAQFFIAPVMDEQYVSRERNAVHSEFTAKYQDEARRAWDVYREVFHPANPSAAFGVGNQNTLADLPGRPVRKDLLAFYQNHYSANRMTLVVLGNESLDVMEKWVRDRFAAVANRQLPLLRETPLPLFASGALPARLLIKPMQNQRELSLSFPVPPFEHWYREKPVEYLAYLLGHEGEGSLFQVLRDRGWVSSLSAGASISNRWSAAFSISMALTEEGYRHKDEIVTEAFRMIHLLRKDGIEKWRYNEQSVVQASAFRFQEKGNAMDYVASLSNNLHYYAVEDVIQGGLLMSRYDEALIRRYLDALRPDNMVVEVSGPDIKTDKQSRYYQTAYAWAPLEAEWRQRWSEGESSRELRLPPPNEFVAKNFRLKKRDTARGHTESPAVNEHPLLLREAPNLRLWFQQDSRFATPRSGIYLYARSAASTEGIEGMVLTEYFVRLLNRHMNSFSYPASLAGLQLGVSARSRGVEISIDGYNDKQGLLLGRTLEALAAPAFSQRDFDKVKEDYLRELQNEERISPYLRVRRGQGAVLSKSAFDHARHTAAARAIELKAVQEFSLRWLYSLNVDVLIHGNVTESDALKLATMVESRLGLKGRAHPDPQAMFVRMRPVATSPLYLMPVDHPDVAVLQYWQGSNDAVDEQARMQLLAQLLGAEFFHQLRTQQQLGYVVHSYYAPLARVPGIGFLVQSPAYSAKQIEDSITRFLGDYARTLAGMKPEEFERQRAALVHRLQETPQSLQEQGAYWWLDINNRYLDFDHREQVVRAVQAITQPELADYYWKVFLGPDKRKLTVVAQPKPGVASRAAAVEPSWLKRFTVVSDPEAFKLEQEYYTLK